MVGEAFILAEVELDWLVNVLFKPLRGDCMGLRAPAPADRADCALPEVVVALCRRLGGVCKGLVRGAVAEGGIISTSESLSMIDVTSG